MSRKSSLLILGALLAASFLPSKAQAWGGFHYAYHYGPNGAVGGVRYGGGYGGYRGYGAYGGYRGGAYGGYRGYGAYGGYGGYHYGGYHYGGYGGYGGYHYGYSRVY